MMERFDKIFDLKGKTVVAVGGGGGIGGTVCLGLADFGANVVVVDLKEEDGKKVVKQIEERGGKGTYIGADCTKPEEIDEMVGQVLSKHGRIDVNVNFLGITVRKPALDLTMEEWNNVLHLNLTTIFNICRAVAKPMIAQKKGKIINYSSVSGVIARKTYAIYSASKGGLINLSKVLCNEWIEYGVNVNTIAPAGVKTDFNRPYFEENPEIEKRLISEIPAGRLGRPEDHIGPVVFLASEASDFICGQLLYVDGGRMVM
jgi:NAD(P)-dependent dehydrogenase (short-subunit alcohol dehydrogenase family)